MAHASPDMLKATMPSRRQRKGSSASRPSQQGTRQQRPSTPIALGPLSSWIGFHLRMAQTASFQAFARLTEEFDIRPGRFAVLMLIGNNPGISQTALSRANGRDKSTLTPALADLTRRRLVLRKRIAKDRRSYGLFLTAQGEAMLHKLTHHAAQHEKKLDKIVGKADRARFLQILQRVATELG